MVPTSFQELFLPQYFIINQDLIAISAFFYNLACKMLSKIVMWWLIPEISR